MPKFPLIHAIDSQGGGKGKSLLTRLLSHYAHLNGYAVQVIDADCNKKNIKPFYPDTIEIAISAEEYWGTDIVLQSLEQGLSVVINLPAGADAAFKRWLDEDGILGLNLVQSTVSGQQFESEIASEQDQGQGHPIQLVRWFLCDATPESLTDFKVSVQSYSEQPYAGRIRHVLVRNYGLSPEFAWNRLDDPDLEALLKQPNIVEMRLPEFKMVERDRVQGLQWTFAQAVAKSEGKEFNTTERQRIVTFLKKVTTALNETGLWNDTPKWHEDVAEVPATSVSKPHKTAKSNGKVPNPSEVDQVPVSAVS